MDKTEIIARRIMGWKLNRWDRWYDPETSVFIPVAEFQPAINLENAMEVVERLEKAGYAYNATEENEVSFNEVRANGATLAEAITKAAYAIADNSSVDDGWL